MGKTIKVAADRAYDQTKTVLPAEVAQGVYMRNAPSLAALKLMHLMIATAGGRMADPRRHEMRLSDIRKINGMKNHNRSSLIPLFEELRAVVIREGDPEVDGDRVVIGGLLDLAVFDRKDPVSGDTMLSWYFGRSFISMAEKSNHWAIMDRQTVFHLTSKYSVLLFQHISSLVNLDYITSKTFTVPELRAMLGVPEGKLSRFSNLNTWAIKPAIAEINQLSRLTLTAKAHKIGRTVASVEIFWELKPDPTAIKRELAHSKVGRKARQTGVEETPVLAFPASGTLKGTPPWEALARKHVTRIQGGHVPDLGGLTDAFRNWCEAKRISLDVKGIDKTFIGFCKNYRPLI